MHLKSLKITNFRTLKNIDVEFDNLVNVVVGPNAIGKSTLLEAIRLAKAILAPRTQNESMQALFALGAASPHMPNRFKMSAIANDENLPVVISCRYKFTDKEAEWLRGAKVELAQFVVRSRLGQSFSTPAALIAFLSSEHGKHQLGLATAEIEKEWAAVESAGLQVTLELTFFPGTGASSTGSQIGPALVSALEGRNPPSETLFSYFPADRALPSGEQPVQLGSADTAAQLESHCSQPQLKYHRLKNTIFNAVIAGAGEREKLFADFEKIFDGVLKGRHIKNVGVNDIGLLSIIVADGAGREFDLDGMSSGEKGLILTFLQIERSVVEGGLILLDEPELHLNPAVSKDLLPFIVDGYAKRKNLQLVICSHSPEILAGAFDRDECALYSLMSGTEITKVRRQDRDVISCALRNLGASESEELLYKGLVFVEGPDDVMVLETGFPDVLRRLKLKDLGGRAEVEKQIEALQSSEKVSASNSMRYFIFDKDDAPSDLSDSASVKVLQWRRRCLENYLIDIDSLTDLLMDAEVAKQPFKNLSAVDHFLKDLAFKQLNERAVRETYLRMGYGDIGFRSGDAKEKTVEGMSAILVDRLLQMKRKLDALSEGEWKRDFEKACAARIKELEGIWEVKWKEECDGKRLFQDIGASGALKMSVRSFKKRVVVHMRNRESESWRSVKDILASFVNSDA